MRRRLSPSVRLGTEKMRLPSFQSHIPLRSSVPESFWDLCSFGVRQRLCQQISPARFNCVDRTKTILASVALWSTTSVTVRATNILELSGGELDAYKAFIIRAIIIPWIRYDLEQLLNILCTHHIALEFESHASC